MHLHDHARAQLFGFEPVLHGDHRQLDQVSRRALHRRIDCGPFGPGAARAVRRIDLGQPQAAAEHRFDIAARLGLQARLVHVLLHAREAREIAFNIIGRRAPFDVQVGRQAEGAHAVDQAEVDDLGVAALFALHVRGRDAEDLGGRRAVDVFAIGKGLEHRGVARDMRHDAQFDLRIVGRDDHAAGRRDERFADTAPFGIAHRDILQVRLIGRQAPRDCHRLRVIGVHAPRTGVDHLRQLVGIGRLELGHAAVLQQDLRQRVILGQLLQHFFVGRRRAGGGLLDHRQAEFDEEDLADLLRRTQVERAAGQLVSLLLEFEHALAQFVRLHAQQVAVDQHAVALDLVQHFHRRHLDVAVDVGEALVRFDVRQHRPVQAQRDVGILGRVLGGAAQFDLVEADLVDALAAHVDKRNRRVAQVAHGHRVHVVRLVRLEYIRLQQRVVHDALQGDAMVGEDVHVVLEVLAELGLGRIFQPGAHLFQHVFALELVRRAGIAVRQRNVGALARFDRQRNAHHLRRHRIERRRFGIDRRQCGSVDQRQPCVQLRVGENRLVLALDDRHAIERGLRAFRRIERTAARRAAGCRAHAAVAGFGAAQVAQHRLEAVAAEKFAQRVGIFRSANERFFERHHVLDQVAVGFHGDQFAAFRQPVERRAQVLAHGATDTAGVFHHAVERAVQREPLDRCFGTALGHARHVVDGVADEGQVIDDAVRRHAELGQHAGVIQALVAHRVDQHDLVIDELGQILVAGGDDRLHAARGGLHGQRADHVVGLDALDHQDRPAHEAHHFMDRLDLLAQVFRHRRTRSLVLGIQVVAEGLAFGIEHAGNVGGRKVGAQAAQHIDHAVHGAGREAVRAPQVGQCMEGAVEIAGTVDEQKGIVHRGRKSGRHAASGWRQGRHHYRRIRMMSSARSSVSMPRSNDGMWHTFHREAVLFATMD